MVKNTHVASPIDETGWRKGIKIRKRKTYDIDSLLIAVLILYGDFLETSLSSEDFLSLRNLSRFRHYIISSIGDLKRKVICVLDQTFPEYSSLFSNIFGETSTAILIQFQSIHDFENITASQLESFLNTVSRKKFTKSKLNAASILTSSSFSLTFIKMVFHYN